MLRSQAAAGSDEGARLITMSASEFAMSLAHFSPLIIMNYVLRAKVSRWTTDIHIAIVLTIECWWSR